MKSDAVLSLDQRNSVLLKPGLDASIAPAFLNPFHGKSGLRITTPVVLASGQGRLLSGFCKKQEKYCPQSLVGHSLSKIVALPVVL